MNNQPKYKMSISLNVLNHLGLNLYSNTPAVIAEVIANAWDADASRVDISYDMKNKVVTIMDDGCGMNVSDINHKYLLVGYQRRKEQAGEKTSKGRKPMGRKGIGKLSLFSIADKILIQSKKDEESNSLLMDAGKIKECIAKENPEIAGDYTPEEVKFDARLLRYQTGTVIKITGLKKRLTQIGVDSLKKRLARRFSVIKGGGDFKIFLNRKEITYADRDYFHKARFLFQYEEDFSGHCNNLEQDEQISGVYVRKHEFNENGNPVRDGEYKIKGWIAVAHRSNDLDERPKGSRSEESDDNLNNIVIVVRGKVAQEDILHQFRMGGLITKYLYGEIEADFLDQDSEDDIATSSRQKIVEDAPRYQVLKKFLNKELNYIWKETNKLKKKKGVKKALDYHPKIKEWYNNIRPPSLREKVDTIFGNIERMEIEEHEKPTLYVNGILAFEKMKMEHALDRLDGLEPERLETMLRIFKDADEIEAGLYYEIVNTRLKVIKTLKTLTKDDEKEEMIRDYVFDRLWLLDPAWERATSEAEMEMAIQEVIKEKSAKDKKTVREMRVDIKYRRVSGAHVIVELKRASRKIRKSDLEGQIGKYMRVVEDQLKIRNVSVENIEGICIVGRHPHGWDNPDTKRKELQSLVPLSIKILTYDELIHNAYSAYAKFIEAQVEVGKLRELIREIREIPESEENSS